MKTLLEFYNDQLSQSSDQEEVLFEDWSSILPHLPHAVKVGFVAGATIPAAAALIHGAVRGARAIGGAIGDYVDSQNAIKASERARFNREQDLLQKVKKRNKNRMTSIDPADKDPNTGKVIDRRAGGGSDTPLSGIFHVSSGRDRGYHGFYLSPDGKSGGHVKVLLPANKTVTTNRAGGEWAKTSTVPANPKDVENLIRQKMAKHTHLTKPQREEITNALIAHATRQSPGQAVTEQYAAYISNQDRRNLFEAKDKPQDPADYAEFSNVRRGRNPESQYAHTDPIDKYIRDNKIKNTHQPDDLYHEDGPDNLKEFPGVMTVHGEFGDEGPDAPVSYYRVHKSVLAKHPDLHKMLQAMDSQAVKQYNKRK